MCENGQGLCLPSTIIYNTFIISMLHHFISEFRVEVVKENYEFVKRCDEMFLKRQKSYRAVCFIRHFF